MAPKKSDHEDIKQVVAKSSRSEERLRDFAEAGSDWFFEMDRDLRFSYVSEQYQEVIGILPGRVIGKTRWDAHKRRHLSKEEGSWQKHIATMKAHESWRDFTYTLIRDDGERRVISDSAKAVFDENGEFVGYRGVGRDVTNQSNAEARLKSVLEAAPDGIITINDEGLINSFSQSAEKMFGFNEKDVLGKNVKMLMPAPYREEHDGYMDHYKITGERKIIGIGREVEAQRKDGTVFPIHLAVNEMLVEGRRMFTGIVSDRTELEHAQTVSARLGDILDRSVNEIYIFDAETLRFVQVNFGARRNMGYSSREFRLLTPVDIKPEFTMEQFAELVEPLRDGSREILVFKTVHQRRDETTYPVEIHLQLMGSEKPPVFAAIIQDITEIDRREAQLRQSQKMEAIGQLTGGIAHDFNNLLTVVIGNNELLMDLLPDNDLQRELLEDATSAAEQGAKLTNQLLAFARRQPLDPRPINLNDKIAEMTDMLRRTLGENIHLQTQLDPGLVMALADPNQIHNAVLNLTINARDAMQNGGELIIETSNADLDADAASERTEAEPGHYVRLSVRDTGSGMPPEVQARILEPFFTTKEAGGGTGLGLSMVHGFAKQSGGFLEIYSEEGHGTAISFYLPDAEEHEQQIPDEDGEPALAKTGGEKVLVVEDDTRVRTITVKRLKHLGYKTVEAESGPQALDVLANRTDIDVIFTDMVMPGGMTGGDLLEEVRKRYPDIKRLVTSGYAEDGIMPNHGTIWLRKPYSLQKMAETFREVLD